jgi:hypothetical protein
MLRRLSSSFLSSFLFMCPEGSHSSPVSSFTSFLLQLTFLVRFLFRPTSWSQIHAPATLMAPLLSLRINHCPQLSTYNNASTCYHHSFFLTFKTNARVYCKDGARPTVPLTHGWFTT